MITLENVSAGYDGKDVLFNASLTLPEGTNLAVLGPNGCGKSTLMKAIAGILPYTGRVLVNGQDAATMPRRLLSQTVALMGQTVSPSFDFTVYDTVMQGRYPHASAGLFGRQATDEDKEIAEHSMAVTGIADLRQRPVTALSGGQLQRVFLARTLAQQPSIILLDEPTNHLDLKYQAELLEYLAGWSAQPGHTVVGVFHDISMALTIADYVLFLKEGRQQAFGPAGEVITPALLQQVFDMDVAAYMQAALRRWQAL